MIAFVRGRLSCSRCVIAVSLLAICVACETTAAESGPATASPDHVAVEPVKAIPDVVGQRPEVARQMLRLAGFEAACGVFYVSPSQWRDEIRPGLVAMQSPKPGMPLREDGLVTCWSLARAGREQKVVSMPDLCGQTVRTATDRLRDIGLFLPVPGRGAVDGDPNEVVIRAQYPSANAAIYSGTYIAIGTESTARE